MRRLTNTYFSGTDSIQKYWTLSPSSKLTLPKISQMVSILIVKKRWLFFKNAWSVLNGSNPQIEKLKNGWKNGHNSWESIDLWFWNGLKDLNGVIVFLNRFPNLCYFWYLGVIFYQNEDGDVLDIQADIIGPCKYSRMFKIYFYLFCYFLYRGHTFPQRIFPL